MRIFIIICIALQPVGAAFAISNGDYKLVFGNIICIAILFIFLMQFPAKRNKSIH